MRRSFAAIAAVLITQVTAGALNFTPAIEQYTSQGFVYRKVTFDDGDRFVTYVPPQGWEVRGTAARASFVPPGKQFVEATAVATPVDALQVFDDAAVKLLAEGVLRDAPEASQAAKLVSEQANAVTIGSNPSHEFVISYQTLGRTFVRSVIYVKTPAVQLIFRFTAPKDDFAVLNSLFRGSLASWQWTDRKPATADSASATATGVQ